MPAARRVYLAAQGAPVTQSTGSRSSPRLAELVLVAGRYEGVDERFVEAYIDESLSVGDIVLSGGELPALVVIDAVARLLPGHARRRRVGGAGVVRDGLLDWPHYTRPEAVAGARGAGGAAGWQPRRDRALAAASRRWGGRWCGGPTCCGSAN